MALTAEIIKWYESFCSILKSRGIDTSNPICTAMLTGASYKLHIPTDENGNELTADSYAVKTDIQFGLAQKASFEKKPDEIENRTGPETIKYYKENYSSLDRLDESEVIKMYNLAKEGKLFFLGENLDYTRSNMIYINDEGGCSISESIDKINFALSPEEQKEFFPGLKNPQPVYDTFIMDAKAEHFKATVADVEGNNVQLEGSRQYYRSGLIYDYMKNPDYYATEELAEKREHLVRMAAVANTDYDYAKEHKDTVQRYELGWEKDIIAAVEKVYDNKYTIDQIIAQGLVRQPSGKTFTGKTAAPWENALQLAEYLAVEKNKLVFFDKVSANDPERPEKTVDKRLGSIKVNPGKLEFKFTKDAPDKGNDYLDPFAQNLETPENTKEAHEFVKQLDALLKKAGLDMENRENMARLKGFYIDPMADGNAKYIERDMLKTWDFKSNGKALDFRNDSETAPAHELNDPMGIGNELMQNTTGLSKLLYAFEINNVHPGELHQIYSMMALAKAGCLTVTLPGKKINESCPIIPGSDGKLQMFNDHAEAEARLGRKFRRANEFLTRSPRSDSREYANALDARSNKLLTEAYYAGSKGMELLIMDLYNEAERKHITKDEYMAQIMAMPRKTPSNFTKCYNDALAEEGVTDFIKPRKIGKSEKQKRESLSLKAQENFFSLSYDVASVDFKYKKLCMDADFTEDEFKNVRTSRDSLVFFAGMSNDPSEVNRNIYRLSLIAGQGIDPKAPGAKDTLDRMYAQAFNETLQEINSFDYSKYTNLSDNELVEKWPEMYAAYLRLSIAKAEIETALEKHADNKYIDKKLAESTLETEAHYMGFSYENTVRMRSIMNPYYSVFPTDIMPALTSEQTSNGYLNVKGPDAMVARFGGFITELNNAHAMSVKEDACYQYIKKYKLPLKEMGNINAYDKDGNSIDILAIEGKIKKNEPVFIAHDLEKGKIMSLAYDKKRNCSMENQSEIDKHPERFTAAFDRINANIQKNIDKVTCYNAAEVYSSTYKNSVERYVNVADEIGMKHLDKEKVKAQIRAYYEKDPDISFDDFKKSISVPEEKLPVPEQRAARKELTIKAHAAMLDAAMAKDEVISNVGTKPVKGWHPRRTRDFLYKVDPVDNEYNKKVSAILENGSIDEQKQLIEGRLRDYLKRSDLFAGTISDEKLIENWSKIRHTGLAMGMEYKKFMEEVEEKGIVINPDLKEKAQLFHERVYAYNDYYINRMEIISSRLYQYGAENLTMEDAARLNTLDIDQKKLQGDLYSYIIQKSTAIGQYVCHAAFAPEGGKAVDAFIDPETGKVIDREMEADYGQMLLDGKELLVLKHGENIFRKISIRDTGNFPPHISRSQFELDPEAAAEKAFAVRDELLKKKKMPEAERKIEQGLLNTKKLLDDVTNDDGVELFEERLADYLAYLGTKNVYEHKNYSEDSMEQITSEDMINNFREGLISSGFVVKVIEKLPLENDKIKALDENAYAKIMQDVRAEYGKAQLEKVKAAEEARSRQAAKTLDEQSAGKVANVFRALDDYKKFIRKDNFFTKEDRNELRQLRSKTKLTKMTLDRTSVQSLTTAMMLNQGYSMDDIMAPYSSEERKKIAHAAIEAVKANDYKFIRENLLKGLDKMNRLVDNRLSEMPEIDITSLTWPRNRDLYAAINLMKDFSQELYGCQDHLKEEDRLAESIVKPITDKAEKVALVGSLIIGGIAQPAARDYENTGNVILKYAGASLMSKYVKYQRGLPENQGKKISEIFNEKKLMEYYGMLGKLTRMVTISEEKMDQAARDKIITAAMDDTLKDYMNLHIEKGEKGLEVKVAASSVPNKIKYRTASKVLLEKVPLQKKEDIKNEAIQKDIPKDAEPKKEVIQKDDPKKDVIRKDDLKKDVIQKDDPVVNLPH